MIKIIFVIAFLIFSLTTYAQEFKKLRLGIGVGYSPSNFLVYLAPSFRIKDQIAIGGRLEAILGNASFGIKAEYYFSNNNFRPFAGLGIGLYHPFLFGDAFYGTTSRLEETVPGFYPIIGFDIGHLTITTEYNMMPEAKAMIYPPGFTSQQGYNGSINGNYFSVKIGVQIGGGRKKIK